MRYSTFDEMIAKGEPANIKAAREAYEKTARAVADTPASDADKYGKAREDKRVAAAKLTKLRQEAEAEFYAEPVGVVKEAVQQFKAEQAKPGTAAPAK